MYIPARIFCISPYLQKQTVQSYGIYRDWLYSLISPLRKDYTQKVSVLVFPEFIGLPLLSRNKKTATDEFFQIFSEIASIEKAYVLASTLEEISGIFYNTAHIFDPKGTVIFSIRKCSLTEEEISIGVSPGSFNQVKMIKLPFAKTGVSICLDAFNPQYISELSELETTLLLQPSANNQKWAAPAVGSGLWQPLEWTSSIIGAVNPQASIEVVINPMLRGEWFNQLYFDGQSSIVTKSCELKPCSFNGVSQSFQAHFTYCGNDAGNNQDEYGWVDLN